MKINEILVEAPTNPRVAGSVPPAVNNLKANQARTAAFNQSKLAAQQAGTAQPATAGTTQPATAGTTQPATAGKTGGILGAVAKGIGKGVVDAVAPGAVNQIKGATYAYNNRVKSPDDEDGHFDHGQWIKGAKQGTQPATQQAGQPAQAQPVDYNTDDDWSDDEEQVVAPTSSGNTLFSDPATFKAEWDKYVESKSATTPYQLITDPAMLAVLKDMWMRTGGTNLKESKKNTRKAA
jgi:hypothetical protein